jgi:ABC-2 type transport system permease protein
VLSIALYVSAKASTARRALVTLFGLWFVACLLAPPLATDLGQRLYPAPTALEFAAALREGKMTLPIWYEQLGGVERRLFAQYGTKNVEELPVSANGIAMVEEEDDFNRVQEEHFGRLYRAHRDQNRVYRWAGLLAPSIAVHSLSMGLAGSDFDQHADFALQAEAYRRDLVQTMNRDLIQNDFERNRTAIRIPGLVGKTYQPGRELWEKVPPFTYSFRSVASVLTTHAPSLASLGLWLLLAVAAAARSVSRLEV